MQGKVEQTFLRGNLIFDVGTGVVGPPRGQYVRRNSGQRPQGKL